MSVKRLSRRQKRQQVQEVNNIVDRKFTMKRINPITKNQEKVETAYKAGSHLANIGTAGTGKTYLSMALALEDVLENELYDQLLIIRSAVQSRDQGFMPGSLMEKMAYYETPYQDIVSDLFGRSDAYSVMKQKGMIRFMSTSFVRGLTFDNTIILVDECQNMSYEELRTIITRCGTNSKIIFCGDTRQDDLRNSKNRADTSGLTNFMKVLSSMRNFTTTIFTVDDICRSGLVKEFIIKEEELLEYA